MTYIRGFGRFSIDICVGDFNHFRSGFWRTRFKGYAGPAVTFYNVKVGRVWVLFGVEDRP